MAKKENPYKEGTVLSIEIGGLPPLDFLNITQKEETHVYQLPSIPHKSEILFSDLPQKEQYWRRVSYKQIFYDFIPGVTKVTEEEGQYLVECLELDLFRRKFGVFFMNNGVPTYLTGNNYFFLQWCDFMKARPTDSSGHSYPQYREFQRDFYYFIDLCTKNNDCLGGYVSKSKKVGVTAMLASLFANEATLYEKIRLGVMSKSGDEAIKTNMAMIKHIINNMPQIILPKKGKESSSEISFSHPPAKPTGTKQYKEKLQSQKEERVLDSVIEAAVTKLGTFDGSFYRYLHFDEFSKYWQTQRLSPKEEFDKDSAALKLQQQIEGKCWLTAYNPEIDDKGFIEARTIFYNSMKSTINYDHINKRTKSELYCYHISALYATEGTFNLYGQANLELAFKLNDQERQSAAGDVNKLQALIRQGSRTAAESWNLGGGSGSVFNNLEIQKSINEKERLLFMKQPFYKRGNLAWEGERLKSRVRFYDDPNGSLYITRNIPEGLLNQWMLPADGQKNIQPTDQVNFIGSLDPSEYKYVDEEGKKGASENSSYILATPNMVMDNHFKSINPNDSWSNRIMAWYCHRPLNPNDFIEDFVMQILYFGMRVLVEDNKAWVCTVLKDMGLVKFLLFQNNVTGAIEPYNPNRKQKEKSTTTGTTDEICRRITLHWAKKPGEPDLCFLCEDVELLNQCMRFDPFNTKPFHKVMSYGYALMALDAFTAKGMIKQNTGTVPMRDIANALMGCSF